MAEQQRLGERVRRLRLERNLTLKDVERVASVSATHISEIERGLTSPTIGALGRIAAALGESTASFLRRDEHSPVRVTRDHALRRWTDVDSGVTFVSRSRVAPDSEMSLMTVSIEPGKAAEPLSSANSGETFLHVTNGTVEVQVKRDVHVLRTGDSLHFDRRDGHSLRNAGQNTAELVWASMPPEQI